MRTEMHKTIIKGFAGALLAASLASCGSGLGTVSTGGGTTNSSVQLGNGTGSSFVSGTLALGSSSLSAGGATSVTATLVDSTGTLYSQPVDVSFNSPCVSSGLATITDSTGAGSGTVTASAGTAIATYTAKGCSGSDTITATATVNNIKLTATATVTVAAAALGSIQFVSATPTVITLKGMGGAGLQETSTVIFAVKDSVGGAVSGATVDFSLNTNVGGVALSASSAVSDANGNVQTIVQAGTFAGPVIVTATTVKSGTTISTQSSQLTINSGIPSQDHFSLSVPHFNVDGGDFDGTENKITVRLADRFGNPVPDGTPISFISNGPAGGGSVQGSCITASGTCNVTWTSQNPRPATTAVSHVGFAYILAYAIGEESFTDNNANGVYDSGDALSDIGEIFANSSETISGDTVHDSGEMFFDYDSDNTYSIKDGKWEGVNCQGGSSLCGTAKSLAVGTYVCFVMSTSEPSPPVLPASIPATGGFVTIDITDLNGNVMAAGTTIELVENNVTDATLTMTPTTDGTTYTVPNTSCAASALSPITTFTITLTPTGPAPSGSFQLKITSPGNGNAEGSGTVTTTSAIPIT